MQKNPSTFAALGLAIFVAVVAFFPYVVAEKFSNTEFLILSVCLSVVGLLILFFAYKARILSACIGLCFLVLVLLPLGVGFSDASENLLVSAWVANFVLGGITVLAIITQWVVNRTKWYYAVLLLVFAIGTISLLAVRILGSAIASGW